MAMRRGMGGPPRASDPTAVRRALTGPPAAWFSSGTMRIAALPLNRKLGRQLDILAVYFGWFSPPLVIEYQPDCAARAQPATPAACSARSSPPSPLPPPA